MKFRLFLVVFVCAAIKLCDSRPSDNISIRALDNLTNVVRVLAHGMKSLQDLILDAIMNQAQNSLSTVEDSAGALLNSTQSLLARVIDVIPTARNLRSNSTQTEANETTFLKNVVTEKLGLTASLLNTTTVLLHNLHNSTADLILSRVVPITNLLSISRPLISSIANRTMEVLNNGVTSFNGLIEAKLNAVTALLNETVSSLMNTVANETETLSKAKLSAAYTVLNASTSVMNVLNNSTHEWVDINGNLLADIVNSTLGILNAVSNRTNHHINGIRKNLTRIMDDITSHPSANMWEQNFDEIQKLLAVISSSFEQKADFDAVESIIPNLNRSIQTF